MRLESMLALTAAFTIASFAHVALAGPIPWPSYHAAAPCVPVNRGVEGCDADGDYACLCDSPCDADDADDCNDDADDCDDDCTCSDYSADDRCST